MNDTDPGIDRRFRQLIMARSQEERLIIGCSMFGAAKQIVKDAILDQNPGITPQRMKEEIFLRFYGMEFNNEEKEKILSVLKNT